MNKPLITDNYDIPKKKEYIVVTKADVDQAEFVEILKEHDIDINIDYDGLKRHYLVSFLPEKYDEMLAEDDILVIEDANRLVLLMESQLVEVDGTGYGGNWGLTRICRRDNWNNSTWYPNSGVYTYFRDGADVDVYVVDTGCRITHNDFGGRASILFDYYLNSSSPAYGIDIQGHGTHVASTIGGAKYGVAKSANLLISRVFESGGATLSAIIAGINACTVHHRNKKAQGIDRPSIMNLSLGGPANFTEEQAINDCINEGIVICAAAGNDGKNLDEAGYDVMPAEIERAITVGSSDIRDRISSFSNYGRMVDVFAPGHYICAAGIENDAAENMISGTSMATPHVAGVCALYAQDKGMTNNAADVLEIHDWIKNNASGNTLILNENVSAAGSPNRLLFSDYIEEAAPVPVPVTEVSRDTVDDVNVVVTRGAPVSVTVYEDKTASTVNPDGSTSIVTTRYYTETITVIVTTTTTTTPITTVTYSDGTTEVITGSGIVSSSTADEISVNEYSEVISEETIPAPVTEVSRETENIIDTAVDRSAPVVTTTHADTSSTVIHADGSSTTTVTRTYTDTSVITVTTTVTTTPVTTVTYSDGTTEMITGEATDVVDTTKEVLVTTRTEVISEVVTPAPTPEPEPEPTPEPEPEPEPKPKKERKPRKERHWRTKGKWSRVKHLKRRLERLEELIPEENRDILEQLEDAAEEFVAAERKEKLKAYHKFMDLYHQIRDSLK